MAHLFDCTENILLFLQEKGKKITESMRQLEKEKMTKMEEHLSDGVEEPDFLVNLFSESVKEEIAVYGKRWEEA